MTRKIYAATLTCLSLFFSTFIYGQSWQWGISGGSSDVDINNFDETVTDMATDKGGNVYVLSKVLQSNLQVDGHPKTGFGDWDIMLSSFSCDGNYRWSKMIGADVGSDAGMAVKTDTLGGVYVTGYMFMGNLGYHGHIDTDTTIATTYKSMFLVKFDTAGIYKWLRLPQADTVTAQAFSITAPLDMDVDGTGNIFMFCQLQQGSYGGGAFIAPVKGDYILKYNATGACTGGFKLEMNIRDVGYLHMSRDHKHGGRYYFAGTNMGGPDSMGTNKITHSMYVGAYNSQGQFLWKRENTSQNRGFNTRPAIDDSGSIVLIGDAWYIDTFNSYVVHAGAMNTVPLVVKVDSNGTNKWAQNDSTDVAYGGGYGYGIALRTADEVVATGSYAGRMIWKGSPTIPHKQPNGGLDIFVTRFNLHTGEVINVDTLASSWGFDENPSVAVGNGKGQIYIGGEFAADLRVAHDTLESIGGQSDFFVAKYGCNCAPIAASYASTVNNAAHSADFTYNGSVPYDSLKWTFGDAQQTYTTGTTTSHTYAVPGTYNVCVTAYTTCDSNTYCHTVQVAVGVSNIAGMEHIIIYPNPSSDELHIDNAAQGTKVRLFNVMGQMVYEGMIQGKNEAINISALKQGTYLITLTDSKGHTGTSKLVKE
ncbi:MAG: T9SS type A sorting domain-containing protein [Bacteroidetes bacterium]|nr:T9SS type A sorting domain-containing protein [Bacteroidota bacterium]